MKYEKYQSDKNSPKSVKYWDSKFIKTDFWIDWILMKAEVESFLAEVKEEFKCKDRKALRIVWSSFIEATCGDEESPMWDITGDFIRGLSEYNMAFYLIHLSIGSDIHDGMTEQEGIDRYVEWLKDSKGNGVYGEYKVTTNLEIVPVGKKFRRKKK